MSDSWWRDDYVWNRDTDELRRCTSAEEALKVRDRRVAKDDVVVGGVDYMISTVCLRTDHSYGGYGPPVLFETMVFSMNDRANLSMMRYSTPAEARAGHVEMVEWVKRKGWEDQDDA